MRATTTVDDRPVVKETIGEAVDRTVEEVMETGAEGDEAVDVVVLKRVKQMEGETVALMVEEVGRAALRGLVKGNDVDLEKL